MSAFFELRMYKVFSGKMDEWIKFMEGTIIPFQVSKGMVIHGSFIVDRRNEYSLKDGERQMDTVDDNQTYVWIRRFSSETSKEKLYKEVYESNEWINNILPIVNQLIDRNSIVVYNLNSTDISTMK
jgi:hypothetical protein